jgi:hypothetical protein
MSAEQAGSSWARHTKDAAIHLPTCFVAVIPTYVPLFVAQQI